MKKEEKELIPIQMLLDVRVWFLTWRLAMANRTSIDGTYDALRAAATELRYEKFTYKVAKKVSTSFTFGTIICNVLLSERYKYDD